MTIPELDEDGGEWTDYDDFDAVGIADMAESFRVDLDDSEPFPNFASAYLQGGTHKTAGAIEYVWQNPTAWEIVGTAVDQAWFMDQVMTRTNLAPTVTPQS
jgi:hypothetical protein